MASWLVVGVVGLQAGIAAAGEIVDRPTVEPSFQPGRDARGRPVPQADLPVPETGLGWGLLSVPVRPPAGPEGIELQLQLWLDPLALELGGPDE